MDNITHNSYVGVTLTLNNDGQSHKQLDYMLEKCGSQFLILISAKVTTLVK